MSGVPAGLRIQRLGSHVESVRPGDRSELAVDKDLGKNGWIPERLEHAGPVAVLK